MSGLRSSVRRTWRGGWATARMDLQVAAQYRANMAVWSIAGVLQVVVYLSVWRAVAEEAGGTTGGYTPAEFAGYFLVLLVVREMTYTWIPYEFPDMVRSGRLAPLLLRPLHPLVGVAASMVAFRSQSTLMIIPSAVVLFTLFDAEVHTSLLAVALGLVTIPLASLARSVMDSLLALTSMWLVRIDGLRGVYYMFLLFLGGQFAPLGVLPHALQVVAKALPFYWMLGYPVELVIGRAAVGDAWIGILVLVGWSLLGLLVLQPTWRRGLQAFEAVGQ